MEQEKAMSVTIKSDGTAESTRVYDDAGREIGIVDKFELVVDAKKGVVRATLTMDNPKFEFVDGSMKVIKSKGKTK